MSMVRVKETAFGNPMKSIVKFPDHYVATTARIKKLNCVQDDSGRYLIKAGTCLKDGLTNGGGEAGATPCTASDTFDSIVMNDEYLAPGEEFVNVTILIHGFVRKGAIVKVNDTVPTPSNSMIIVM